MATPLTNLVPRAGPQGPAGTNLDISIVAGENLAIRDCVFIAAQGVGGRTAGRVYKSDADTLATSTAAFIVGFATAAITAGDSGLIRIAGIMSGFSSLTFGVPQYVSAVAGSITEVAPTNSVFIGMSISDTEVVINTRGLQTAVNIVGIKGYISGGSTGGAVATTDLLTFATDTTAAQTSANITARSSQASFSDGLSKGYIAGGYTTNVTNINEKIIFATNTTSTVGVISQARYGCAGCSERSTKGYCVAGNTNPTYVMTADKTTFASDTSAAVTTANLSSGRFWPTCVSEGTTKGYFAGGDTTLPVNTGDKLIFSTDTTAVVTTANLTTVRYGAAGISEGSTKGYFAGGNSGGSIQNIIDIITFSTDTTAASTSTLSTVRYYVGGQGAGSIKGYVLGGYSGVAGGVATADKITYSGDVVAAATTANLSQARYSPGGFSDAGL